MVAYPVRAETLKILTLPSTWIAALLALGGPPALAGLSSRTLRHAIETGDPGSLLSTSTVDAGFLELSVGLIGAIVVGVVCFSSEYRTDRRFGSGSPQMITSLAATPQRLELFAAKATAVAVVVSGLVVVSCVFTFAVVGRVLGPFATPVDGAYLARCLGLVLYWVFTAELAFAVATLARNGVVPLIVLIADNTLVSVSYLLTNVTSAANYLPDIAGARMFLRDEVGFEWSMGPVEAAAVMAGWVLVLGVAAGLVFRRRDV